MLEATLTADHPGEFRAVAVTEDGQAVQTFLQRWSGQKERLRWGQTAAALVRSYAPDQGGYFLEVEGGEHAFLASRPDNENWDLGAHVQVLCVTEARHDKLARVKAASDKAATSTAYEMWRQSLPGGDRLVERDDPTRVDAAFEYALMTRLTLPKGGRLRIQATQALTAVDIDTAGRQTKGRASERAHAINTEALQTLARQICLADLGGLFVVDLIGPLHAQSGKALREITRSAFTALTSRRVKCLLPSPLDLMEMSVARGARPLPDCFFDADGAKTAETDLLDWLRDAHYQLQAERTKFYALSLSPSLYEIYTERCEEIEKLLSTRYSNRLSIAACKSGEPTHMAPR